MKAIFFAALFVLSFAAEASIPRAIIGKNKKYKTLKLLSSTGRGLAEYFEFGF